MKAFQFQESAVADMVKHLKKLLAKKLRADKAYSTLLKAPTGAGKTVMLAEVMSQLVGDGGSGAAFIWLAPYSLHDQSYQKLRALSHERGVTQCLLLEEVTSDHLPEDSISFVNWASVSGDTKKLRKQNEKGTSLEQLVAATKARGLKLIVVVDESHHSLKGPEARSVIEGVIAPHLVIEVTATPVLLGHDEQVTVHRDEVVAENVIRKGVFINPTLEQGEEVDEDAGTVTLAAPGSQEEVLDAALKLREQLVERYKAAGSAVRPLVLVQLPDKSNGSEEALEALQKHLLVAHGVQEANGRLAVWLSDNKVNLDNLVQFDSTVEVLFFKQGIALGWDCPRAQILVSLREMKSPSFTSQVLGRILRQPELQAYEDDSLNHGYVFVNHEAFSIKREMDSIRTKSTMKLIAATNLALPNVYRLSADTGKKLKKAVVQRIHDTIKAQLPKLVHQGEVRTVRIANAFIDDVDSNQSVQGETQGEVAELDGLEVMLDHMVAELIRGTSDQIKGKKYVLEGLLGAARDLSGEAGIQRLHEVLLHPKNKAGVYSAAMDAILAELASAGRKAKALKARDSWDLPKTFVVPYGKKVKGLQKCIYGPVYGTYFDNEFEKDFAVALDTDSSVQWWMKNGRNGAEHFSLAVGADSLFFPDWLVQYTDGSVGVYDTKAHGKGGSAATFDAKAKSDALQAYLDKLRTEGVQVKGGLVVRNEAKRWKVFAGKDYTWTEALTGWDNLF